MNWLILILIYAVWFTGTIGFMNNYMFTGGRPKKHTLLELIMVIFWFITIPVGLIGMLWTSKKK